MRKETFISAIFSFHSCFCFCGKNIYGYVCVCNNKRKIEYISYIYPYTTLSKRKKQKKCQVIYFILHPKKENHIYVFL